MKLDLAPFAHESCHERLRPRDSAHKLPVAQQLPAPVEHGVRRVGDGRGRLAFSFAVAPGRAPLKLVIDTQPVRATTVTTDPSCRYGADCPAPESMPPKPPASSVTFLPGILPLRLRSGRPVKELLYTHAISSVPADCGPMQFEHGWDTRTSTCDSEPGIW